MENNITVNYTDLTTAQETSAVAEENGFKKLVKILRRIRYFLPLLSSVGWAIGFLIGDTPVLTDFALALIAIGYISALCTCPKKIFKFIFMVTGVSAGVTFYLTCWLFALSLIPTIVVGAMAFAAALSVVVYAPGLITLYNYFFNSEYTCAMAEALREKLDGVKAKLCELKVVKRLRKEKA